MVVRRLKSVSPHRFPSQEVQNATGLRGRCAPSGAERSPRGPHRIPAILFEISARGHHRRSTVWSPQRRASPTARTTVLGSHSLGNPSTGTFLDHQVLPPSLRLARQELHQSIIVERIEAISLMAIGHSSWSRAGGRPLRGDVVRRPGRPSSDEGDRPDSSSSNSLAGSPRAPNRPECPSRNQASISTHSRRHARRSSGSDTAAAPLNNSQPFSESGSA